MQNLNYKELQKIEIDITKKLLEYINVNMNMEEMLNNIDFMSDNYSNEAFRLSFNIWLSMDFIDSEGKTFIDSFLEDEGHSLNPIEKQILREKSNSHISLFQILKYENEYMYIRDILNDYEYKLWEPQLNNAINEGEFLFSRIGKILEEYTFIGDIHYVPSSMKPIILEEILKDFNILRKENKSLTIKDYLKNYSLNVYKIYNESIRETIEIEGDIHAYLFDELEEFEGYLLGKDKGSKIQKHLTNLVNIFEYYLSQEDMTLYDLDEIDFKVFFPNAIEDSFISSQDELNSYISTLKTYLSFLNKADDNYDESYQELLDISKNRFYYMNLLNQDSGFKIDNNLLDKINLSLNDDALTLVMDYEKFLIFLGEKPLELTVKNKYIKRKHLLEINDLLEFTSPILTSAPNQKDFPLIHFFYYVSLNLSLIEINNHEPLLTNKGISFLRLKDEEKYSVLFNYLWSHDFIKEILEEENTNHCFNKKNQLGNIFSTLKSNNEYYLSNILLEEEDIFLLYHNYFKYFGLVESSVYNDISFVLTNLGKKVFSYLKTKKSSSKKPEIIILDDYRV